MGKLPENYVGEFMRRTLVNLVVVQDMSKQQAPDSPKVYEVTQLVNSLLGLLVLPKEKSLGVIGSIRLDDPRAGFFPKVDPVCPMCGKVETVGEYLRLLRNGIAHFNIEFEDDGEDITDVFIENKDGRGRVTHTFHFSVDDMERFAIEFPKVLGVELESF